MNRPQDLGPGHCYIIARLLVDSVKNVGVFWFGIEDVESRMVLAYLGV